MMCSGFSLWCHSVFPTVAPPKRSWEDWQIGYAELIPVTNFPGVVFLGPSSLAVLYCMSNLIHWFDSFLGFEWTVVKLPVCSSSTFPLPWINQRPQSWGSHTTHPFFHIKGMSSLSLLCKLVLILYTWPSGTKAQLWLIETKNKSDCYLPRSLRNRRRGRLGTEIAKGQGGRPIVGAHLSRSLCTCMYKHTDKSHTGL